MFGELARSLGAKFSVFCTISSRDTVALVPVIVQGYNITHIEIRTNIYYSNLFYGIGT